LQRTDRGKSAGGWGGEHKNGPGGEIDDRKEKYLLNKREADKFMAAIEKGKRKKKCSEKEGKGGVSVLHNLGTRAWTKNKIKKQNDGASGRNLGN